MNIYIKLLGFVVLVQTFHMIEHIAQVVQVFLLNIPRNTAHGLLGILDFEWVHFIYNAILLLSILLICKKFNYISSNENTFTIFATGTGVQGYHMVEHLFKIKQHIQTKAHGTPGILGNFLDPILFHFFINLVVYLAILYAFLYFILIKKENFQRLGNNYKNENNNLHKRNSLQLL